MKARIIKNKVVKGTDETDLQTKLTAWFSTDAEKEAEFISITRVADYAVLILYTL